MKIKDIVTIRAGFAFKGEHFTNAGTPVIKIKNISQEGNVNTKDTDYIDLKNYPNLPKDFLLKNNDWVIAMTGAEIGKTGKIYAKENEVFLLNQRVAKVESPKQYNNDYVGYLLSTPEYQKKILDTSHGSAQANISSSMIEDFEIPETTEEERKRIANILSSFDNKIEILKKENKILEDIAENIFKEWFVKYNFPNKDGKPYKDNGGQMIDSELGPIPEGCRVGKLGEYFPVTTGKRNANHARENGEYMFFTCSQDNLLCDEYSFNNGALLLAGNGDFNIKWYKGKFDAYQRTYVLIPYNQEQLGYLFFLMKHYLSDIIIGNRGSVISFITKGMIEDFTVFIPNEKIEKQANKVFSSIIQQQAQNDTKINVLTKTKNTLIKDLIK